MRISINQCTFVGEYFRVQKDWRDRQHIFPNEEKMIIDRLEKPAMQSLGFGYRTEHNTYANREQMIENTPSLGAGRRGVVGSYYIHSSTPTKLE